MKAAVAQVCVCLFLGLESRAAASPAGALLPKLSPGVDGGGGGERMLRLEGGY